MTVKLGINGFGRIGRVIFRACLKKADLEVAAINDPAIDVDYICYLIKFDSTHGKFCGSVTQTKNEIVVDGCHIKIYHEKLPSNVPWQTAGVQYVIEASGMFTSLEKASGHLASASVKRVIVTAPSIDVPMLILGVNEDKFNAGHKVISCASSTLYCLAPIIKVLEDSFGVAEGFITSIHAMTPSLKPLDGLCLRGRHWRDHRSIHQNIIPASTGACKALGRILPRVKDKLSGLAFRVPIVNVSVLDLTVRLSSNTTVHEILKNVEKASSAALQHIIKVSRDEAVSSDFIGETHSCILDAESSLQLKPNFFKLVCWYENEFSYACRVLDSVYYSEQQTQLSQLNIPIKTSNLSFTIAKKQDSVQQTEICKRDVLCSASQDTGLKPKHQHTKSLIFNKPISTHNSITTQSLSGCRDTRKRNETFKIWDDVKESPKPIRQNKSPFFHSCVAIKTHSREEIECMKAHERLEMLKKEFSKMVNITERLLKKSYNSNVRIKPEDPAVIKNEFCKPVNIMPDINVEEIKQSCETFSEIYHNVQRSSPLFDVGGDCKPGINSQTFNVINKVEIGKSIPQFKMCSPKKFQYESRNKLIILENIPKCKPPKGTLSKLTPVKVLKINDNKENSDEINVNSNIETKNVPQCIHVQYCVMENNSNKNNDMKSSKPFMRAKERLQERERPNWKSRIENDNDFFALFKKKKETDLIQNKEDANNEHIEEYNTESNTTPCTNTENKNKDVNKLQKDNKLDNVQNNTLIVTSPILEMETLNDDIGTLPANTEHLDENLAKQSSEDVIGPCSPDTILTDSDQTSMCGSPVGTSLTVSNVEVNKHKQDIYDKLDSISGTDSNNSFQIHERKSQIINLSDLTSSLEDLSRLDKICKIIEISDDLSNKLFSALDSTEGLCIKKKKWSFKDLCEKIKLDDFCEKIFGNPSE